MRRLAVVLLVLCACGGGSKSEDTTTTAPTSTLATTTTVDPKAVADAELAADKKLIVALWRDQSDSWGNGMTRAEIDAGFQHTADATYPGTSITASSCELASNNGRRFKSYSEEIIVDQATIERDDGWTVNGGELAGVAPSGRVYIMTLTFSSTADGIPFTEQTESHAAILDGKAYQFPSCI